MALPRRRACERCCRFQKDKTVVLHASMLGCARPELSELRVQVREAGRDLRAKLVEAVLPVHVPCHAA